jgi:hypothetical protein
LNVFSVSYFIKQKASPRSFLRTENSESTSAFYSVLMWVPTELHEINEQYGYHGVEKCLACY